MSERICRRWPQASVEKLRAMWPRYTREAILAAFPLRTWDALENKALELGLRRQWKFGGRVAPTKDPVMDQLRDAREARGLTAKRLSGMIGLSDRYVSQCERGALNPNLHTVIRWCAALGVRLKLEKDNSTAGMGG